MHTKFTILFLAASTIATKAQTLSKVDIEPRVGDNYNQISTTSPESTDPGSAGKNQVYNLSNLHYGNTQYAFAVLHPDSAPTKIAGTAFILKKFPVSDSTAIGHAYYKDTVTGYYLLRDIGSLLDIKYTIPDFIFKFPLTFGDSIMAVFKYASTAFSITYNYTGTSKLIFDGTGTLVMPDSTSIPGVYRLKYTSKTIRALYNDTSYVTQYAWYLPGIHHPLAEHTEYTDPNGLLYESTRIYDASNTAWINTVQSPPLVVIYPNPAANFLHISGSEMIDEITLTSLSGQQLWAQKNLQQSTIHINIGELANGMYLFKIHKNQQAFTHKIIVEH